MEEELAKPKILTRMIKQLEDKGMDPGKAHAIAVSQLQKSGNLKKGSTEPTKKGIARGNMSPAERAKDRTAKSRGGKPSDYTYHSKTNTATKKK
jgi:hypothetical protein